MKITKKEEGRIFWEIVRILEEHETVEPVPLAHKLVEAITNPNNQ